jgi:hypothetical protein
VVVHLLCELSCELGRLDVGTEGTAEEPLEEGLDPVLDAAKDAQPASLYGRGVPCPPAAEGRHGEGGAGPQGAEDEGKRLRIAPRRRRRCEQARDEKAAPNAAIPGPCRRASGSDAAAVANDGLDAIAGCAASAHSAAATRPGCRRAGDAEPERRDWRSAAAELP